MTVCSGRELSNVLRNACDPVQHRLWIASPYIGAWHNVRRLLGNAWWAESIEVRLLTDEDGCPNGDTLRRFMQRGPIYHLPGLHAKIYIADDKVLLTSANLTGAAFSKRHEIGIMLQGQDAARVTSLYETWLASPLARPFNLAKLEEIARKNRGEIGEDLTHPLPELNPLPPDPGDFGGNKLANLFLDYERFRRDYRTLTEDYASVQRIWPTIPIYFEMDGFLDFLFHQQSRVSNAFKEKPFRKLTPSQRKEEIRKYATQFQSYEAKNDKDGEWRPERSATVRRLLSPANIENLTQEGILSVVECLNCMNDGRQRNRFLTSPKNSTRVVKAEWKNLLHGTQPLTERMSRCASNLFSFKRSSVQELLGFYDPDQYPIRNLTVNAGLRFFGFDVSAD